MKAETFGEVEWVRGIIQTGRTRQERTIIDLADEIDRLRAGLHAIVGRARGGPGAAVCVTTSTLATIAEQTLNVSETWTDKPEGGE